MKPTTLLKKILRPVTLPLLLQIANILLWSLFALSHAYAMSLFAKAAQDPQNVMQALKIEFFICLGWLLSLLLHGYLSSLIIPTLQKNIFAYLHQHLLNHPLEFHTCHQTGTLNNRLRDASNNFPELLSLIIDYFILTAVQLLFTILALYSIAPRYLILFLLWLVPSLLLLFLAYPKSKKISAKVTDAQSDIMGHTSDVLNNIQSVHLFSGQQREEQYLHKKLNHHLYLEKKQTYWFIGVFLIRNIINLFLFGSLLWIVKKEIENGQFDPANTTIAFMLLLNMVITTYPIGSRIEHCIKLWSTTSRALHTILIPSKITDNPQAPNLTVTKGAIKFSNVQFAYNHTQNPFFQNLNLTFKPGEQVAIIGYSGSGKSSLFQLILRHTTLQKGTISIDGQDISQVNTTSLRESMSVVSQHAFLFDRTILENLRYARPEATLEEIEKAAKMARAHDFIQALPKGYHTRIGEGATTLSGGQRQRIVIARAFLRTEAPILLIDEATSALDVHTTAALEKELDHLRKRKKRTTLVITHSLNTIATMDRILIMDQGKIIADGTHQELLQNAPIYRSFREAITFSPSSTDTPQ